MKNYSFYIAFFIFLIMVQTKVRGQYNANCGEGAGTNGSYNTSIGYYAGHDEEGWDNVFLGYFAGRYSWDTDRNIFIGSQSGMNNDAAFDNTYVGYRSGVLTETGGSNTIIGSRAGTYNVSGYGNVYVGSHAGYNNTGSGNIFLGNQAGYSETGSNKLYIANSNTSTPLIYGEFNNQLVGINGKLGIGITNPNESMELFKNSAIQVAAQYGNSNTGSGSGNGFIVGIETAGNGLIWNRENNFIRFGTNGSERLRIAGDGKVGIGTSTPGTLLDLGGSGASSGMRATDGTGLVHVGIGVRTPNRAEIHVHSNGQDIPGDIMFGHDSRTDANVRWTISDRGAADGRLIIYEGPRNTGAGFIDRVHIKGGNVGIGANPVNARLVVEGDGTYDGVFRLNNTGTNGSNVFLVASNSSWDIGGNKLGIGIGSPASGNVKMVIQADGNIGIGTDTASYKLDVYGTIRAREVKVDLDGVPVPDFVFKEGYPLMDLKEMEHFVHVHHHLPEIPSEREMTENGVNMKEMQMKLLQKIEELTLYTIELNRELENLQIRIKELEQK